VSSGVSHSMLLAVYTCGRSEPIKVEHSARTAPLVTTYLKLDGKVCKPMTGIHKGVNKKSGLTWPIAFHVL